tara:strand:+ start:245 stop:664 length:420 start_codon:yes stop_codon:yes gene_type:complete
MNYKIVAKYIKHIKFEIPNPKIFFLLEKNIANYKINIDIKSSQFKDKIVEVDTSLTLTPTNNDFDKIETKIIFSTIIELDGEMKDKKSLEEIILIKVPSEIYSELRSIFIFLFQQSGYKKIKIDEKVNFKDLYEKKIIQ